MPKAKYNKLFRWEKALLLGLGLSLLAGSGLAGQQRALADRLVRLHVVAATDSQHDQAIKRAVRDAVLEEASRVLEGAGSREEAMAALSEDLDALAQAGAVAAGEPVRVSASLEEGEWFPTKDYGDFSLPAGRYPALKIVLGEGKGHNWWCVVYPQLCAPAAVETLGSLSQEQVSLITEDEGRYIIRFRAMELLGQLSRVLH